MEYKAFVTLDHDYRWETVAVGDDVVAAMNNLEVVMRKRFGDRLTDVRVEYPVKWELYPPKRWWQFWRWFTPESKTIPNTPEPHRLCQDDTI